MPVASNWASNTTIGAIAEWVRGGGAGSGRRVVVLTHVKPDGDALGSTLGVTRALAAAGVHAVPWYYGPLPDWLAALAGPTKYRVIDALGLPPEEPDAILILDTGSWSQVHEVEDWLRARQPIAGVIDHHAHGDPDIAPRRVVSVESAAACQPAAELCRVLLGVERLDDLPRDVAEPLYLGIATDTGWFRHSNVTPTVLRDAAGLLAAGARAPWLYEITEQQDRPSRLRLMARALGSLQELKSGRAAMMTITQQDFHDCHAAPTDSAGFVDLPLTVAGVMVSIFVTETFTNPNGTHITKVSLRSKEGAGAVDVNEVARKLGGGGHIRAAGAKLSLPLDEAKKRIIEALG